MYEEALRPAILPSSAVTRSCGGTSNPRLWFYLRDRSVKGEAGTYHLVADTVGVELDEIAGELEVWT